MNRRLRMATDEGSMALAMLVMIVSVSTSTLLAAVVAQSVIGGRADTQAVHAVNSAHAGLNVGLARVMKLGMAPTTVPADCILDGATGNGQYHVTLAFYAEDPAAAVCPFNKVVHRYARITAVGSDGHSGRARALVGTYAFPLGSVSRPAGGRLVFNDATDNTCLTDLFQLSVCDPTATDQIFVYGSDLTLSQVDVSTLQATCVTTGPAQFMMKQCDATDSAQRWIFNGRTFVTVDGTTCLDSMGGQNAAVLPGTGTRCAATAGTFPTWQPDATVGAGNAASTTVGGIINASGFGSCLTASATVTTCPQTAPAPVWTITPVAGTSYVTVMSGPKCLTTTAAPAGSVILTNCTVGALNQRWTAPAVDSTWASSFRMSDAYGRCLAAAATADPYTGTAVVTDCSESSSQKWNVDVNAQKAGLMKVEAQ